ncbi:MAG: hypothetical protein ACFCBV_04390 [Phycisphaerales bacterium]
MRVLFSFVLAFLAALIGAIGWAAIASSMERELIGLSLVVAVLAGIGARFGVRLRGGGRAGVLTGVMAVIATFIGMSIGLAVPDSQRRLEQLRQINSNFESALPPYTPDVLMAYITQGVADEWEAEGRVLDWPPQTTSEMLRYQRNQFPAEAWAEAVLRFESLDLASQREVNKLWALEHDKRRRRHEINKDEAREQQAAHQADPEVRRAAVLGSLILAGLIGGLRRPDAGSHDPRS